MIERVVQIDFIDRPGLGYEIFQVCEKNSIDKIAMEAFPRHGMVIKFRCASETQVQHLLEELAAVPHVREVELREQMPGEEKAYELQAILNSVGEGIVAVGKTGTITHINEVACRIFGCIPEDTVGTKVEMLFNAQTPVLETLKNGRRYHLLECRIQRGGRVIHIMTSGVPVLGETNQIIGAVCTIKDYRQVEEIASKVQKRNQLLTFADFAYHTPVMLRLVSCAKTVAKGASTILLRGESGTGKELFATAIHMEGRQGTPFVAVNCAALPDSLLESELFGYEEGAFTGAAKGGRKGLFEQAHEGTLFLDEVGEISLPLQVKLLRVLQEGTVRRVGGREIAVNVRIIAATHCNLEAMVNKGQFREDLYYRLNVIPLHIPPLRERVEDIPLIAQHLVRKILLKLGKPEVRLTKESVKWLMAQPWPGNVRQLENMLERVLNLVDTPEITVAQLLDWADMDTSQRLPVINNDGAGTVTGSRYSLKVAAAEAERRLLTQILAEYPSSRQAAAILGVSNTTVLNKMKALGIHPAEGRGSQEKR